MRQFFFVATLCVVGCSRANVDSAADGSGTASSAARPAPAAVEVLTDPAAIDAARKKGAQDDARLLEMYFSGFTKQSLVDYDLARRFRAHPEASARLIAIRDDAKAEPKARARAASLLCGFRDPTCWDGFVALLSAAPDVTAAALRSFGSTGRNFDYPPDAIITRIAALVRSSSPDVRDAAVTACRELGIPQATEDLLAVLRGVRPGPKAEAAEALARDAPSVEVATLTLGVLQSPRQGGLDDLYAASALRTLAAHQDAAIAAAARKAIATHAARPGATDDDKSNVTATQDLGDLAATAALARQAAERLAALGVIDAAPDAGTAAAAWRARLGSRAEVSWLLMDALLISGVVLVFDTETGEVPVHHDFLLLDLAAISRGAFAPTAVSEEFKNPTSKDDTDGPYLVQFVHQDRLYRVTAENLGDWYDVPAMLAIANRAVADTGAKERFITLYTGDQTAQVLFADPAAVKTAAAESLLVLEDDPDSGRRDGKAFEEQMIEQLKKKK